MRPDDVDEVGIEAFGQSQRVGQCDIAFPGDDRGVQFMEVGFEVIDSHVGVAFLELRVDERQSGRGDGREDPDREIAAQRLGQSVRGLSQSVGGFEEWIDLEEEASACG